MSSSKFNDKTPINHEGAECPYCGTVMCDMWESIPNDGDSEVIDCDCGNKFEVTTCITVDYRSNPLVCTTHSYGKYDWSKWSLDVKREWQEEHPPKGQYSRYRQCTNCDDGYEHQHEIIKPCGEDHQWEEEWSFWFPNDHSSEKENSWRVRHCKYHGRDATNYNRKDFTEVEIEQMKASGDYYIKDVGHLLSKRARNWFFDKETL